MMKASELVKETPDQLSKKFDDLSREVFNLRMQQGTNQLTQNHQLRLAKKNIARVQTVLSQMKKQQSGK